jgi:hypothetical protein
MCLAARGERSEHSLITPRFSEVPAAYQGGPTALAVSLAQ